MRTFLKSFIVASLFVSSISFASNPNPNLVGVLSDNPIRIGIRSGSNWTSVSKFDLIRNITPDFKPMPAPQGAVFIELPITDNFSIQPEIAFSQKGFMIKQSISTPDFALNIPVGIRASFRVNYMEVPVLAKIKFGDDESLQGYIVAGPSIGYATNGFAQAKLLGLVSLGTIPVSLNTFNYNRAEFSGIGGAGVNFSLGSVKLFAEARYQHGLSRLFDTPIIQLPVRNRGMNVSLGLSLPLNR